MILRSLRRLLFKFRKRPAIRSRMYAIVSATEAAQDPYPYTFVNHDGTARELHEAERQYRREVGRHRRDETEYKEVAPTGQRSRVSRRYCGSISYWPLPVRTLARREDDAGLRLSSNATENLDAKVMNELAGFAALDPGLIRFRGNTTR